jgi:hypothetical protein
MESPEGRLNKGDQGLRSREDELKKAFREARESVRTDDYLSTKNRFQQVFGSFTPEDQESLQDLFESMETVLDEDRRVAVESDETKRDPMRILQEDFKAIREVEGDIGGLGMLRLLIDLTDADMAEIRSEFEKGNPRYRHGGAILSARRILEKLGNAEAGS